MYSKLSPVIFYVSLTAESALPVFHHKTLNALTPLARGSGRLMFYRACWIGGAQTFNALTPWGGARVYFLPFAPLPFFGDSGGGGSVRASAVEVSI